MSNRGDKLLYRPETNSMDSSKYFISWGSQRYVPIRRFEDLRSDRHDLIRYYEEVLQTGQTFTQHFSTQPLESYDLERSLAIVMGCDPSSWNQDANSPSICWLDIVRHGNFQQQDDGCYHCFIQGKVIEFDQQSHDRIEFCRSHALQISSPRPSQADTTREEEITLEIFDNVCREQSDKLEYTRHLEKLKQKLKIRLSEIRSSRDPITIYPTPTSDQVQYLTPREPETAVFPERLRASSSAQSCPPNGSSGSEMASEDDSDMSFDCSSEDSSEDETGDEIAEYKVIENNGPEKDNGTGDDSSSQQTKHNSNNGGKAALDGDIAVPSNSLSSRTSSSMSRTRRNEAIMSTSRISLPESLEKDVSVSPMQLKDLSSISEIALPMDPRSSPNDPELDMRISHPKCPPRKRCNKLSENENPRPRAYKRRQSINVSKAQKRPRRPDHMSDHQERSAATAWMKAHLHENWNQTRFVKEYRAHFGRSRTYLTLKRWMDEKENSQGKSRIVRLKVPITCPRETLSNDNSSSPTSGRSNGKLCVPSTSQNGPSEKSKSH